MSDRSRLGKTKTRRLSPTSESQRAKVEGGVRDSEDNNWNIVDSRSGQAQPWEFTLVVPPDGTFRVHADG
jgi:hypothetical protein